MRYEPLPKMKGGLRALYRTLEWTRSRPLTRPYRAFCFAKSLSPFPKRLKCPGANLLKHAHAALETAVLAPWSSTGGGNAATGADYSTGRAAYGFSATKNLLVPLLALNQ